MVLRIKFVSEEVEGFLREIDIDSDATFLDLHKIILASCQYDDSQMNSFFICDDEWERKQEILREVVDFGNSEEDILAMETTRLSEFIEDKGQKLEYIFDTFSERSFFLKVKEIRLGEMLAIPSVVRSEGEPPAEIEIPDDEVIVAPKGGNVSLDDFDDPFAGGAFNDDELDLEGFEVSDNPY